MNKLIAPLLVFITVNLMFYLTGSFGAATFDISLWAAYERCFLSFLSMVASSAATFAYCYFTSEVFK